MSFRTTVRATRASEKKFVSSRPAETKERTEQSANPQSSGAGFREPSRSYLLVIERVLSIVLTPNRIVAIEHHTITIAIRTGERKHRLIFATISPYCVVSGVNPPVSIVVPKQTGTFDRDVIDVYEVVAERSIMEEPSGNELAGYRE